MSWPYIFFCQNLLFNIFVWPFSKIWVVFCSKRCFKYANCLCSVKRGFVFTDDYTRTATAVVGLQDKTIRQGIPIDILGFVPHSKCRYNIFSSDDTRHVVFYLHLINHYSIIRLAIVQFQPLYFFAERFGVVKI